MSVISGFAAIITYVFIDMHTIKPLEGRKRPSVVIIGGGFGGICAGIKLQKAGFDYKIIEKKGEFGGTWFENTYPGAACDVPAHSYCFSFDLNPFWTKFYAPQKQILAYI